VVKGFKKVIPDPEEHVGNDTESDNRRITIALNFSIHESATIASGLKIPSQKHRLFLLLSLFRLASGQEIRGQYILSVAPGQGAPCPRTSGLSAELKQVKQLSPC